MRWQWVVVGAICTGCVVAGGLVVEAADKLDQGLPSNERNWQIGFTPSVSSGDFGTNTTSTFVYAPLSIRRLFRDGDVTVVIPFVTATTDGRATFVGGTPVRVDNSGPGSSNSDCDKSGPGQGSCLTGRAPGQKVTTAGLGDIILKGRYYVVEEHNYVPLIALTGRMKLPTASASQGLGTGAFDYGVGIETSKMLGEKWIAFLDGGYNIIGDPDGLPLNNQYWYDIGAGYYFTKALLASVYFEEYQAILPGFVNARDVFFAVNYTASAAWRFNGGVTVGLSNGAPDHTFSVGASYRF